MPGSRFMRMLCMRRELRLIINAEMGEDIPDPWVSMTVASVRGQSIVIVPWTLWPWDTPVPSEPVGAGSPDGYRLTGSP